MKNLDIKSCEKDYTTDFHFNFLLNSHCFIFMLINYLKPIDKRPNNILIYSN